MIENCSVILGQFSSRYISRDTACEKYFGNFLNFYRRCLWHVLRGGRGVLPYISHLGMCRPKG